MKKIAAFLVRLVRAANENDLFALAAELSYKLIFALFPFLIFLMSLVSFFRVDAGEVVERMALVLPDRIMDVLRAFMVEVVAVRSGGVLSVSLLVTVFSASSGFNAVIRGINRAYRVKETRHFVRVRLVGMLMVLVFAAAILASVLLLIFGDGIYVFLTQMLGARGFLQTIFGVAGYFLMMLMLLFTIILIYKFSGANQPTVYDVFPGAFTSLMVWVVASKAFNVYVNRFSSFSNVYGSISSVFVLMLWLNIISAALLLGGEVNALLANRKTEA